MFKRNSIPTYKSRGDTIKLCIEGCNFVVPLSNEVIIACDKLKHEAPDILENLNNSTDAKATEVALAKALKSLVVNIESILGVGSVKEMFGNKVITLFALTNIGTFLRAEITKAISKQAKPYKAARR